MKVQVNLEGDRKDILRKSVNLEKAISYLIPVLEDGSEMSIEPAINGGHHLVGYYVTQRDKSGKTDKQYISLHDLI